MIIENVFCKKCGQKVNKNVLSGILGQKFVELDDGTYCFTCGQLEVKKRRGQR